MTAPGEPLGADTLLITTAAQGPQDHNFMPTPGAPANEPIPGCSVQPLSTTEIVTFTDLTITDKKALCPVSDTPLALTTADTIAFAGVTYQVYGVPQLWYDLYGTPHHVTVYLRKAAG